MKYFYLSDLRKRKCVELCEESETLLNNIYEKVEKESIDIPEIVISNSNMPNSRSSSD